MLGGGFKHVFPKENEWLLYSILEKGGCIITEYEPEREALSSHFPQRNRIISGLSDAILVVEATHRSGSTITAGYAKQQGKKVFCIPSNIDSKNGVGTNRLIQEGAILVTKASEIVKEYFSKQEEKQQVYHKEELEMQKIPKEYQSIYKIIARDTIHINEIGRVLKQNIAEITPILTILELEGYIEQLSGNQFKRKER